MNTFPLSTNYSVAGTLTAIGIFLSSSTLQGCGQVSSAASVTEDDLIAMGRDLFFNETFDGNGRTCGTCHPEENNFTIDPAFIATLPDDDPLFVAEFNLELADLEKPALLREFGLILENQDGFDDLDNKFNLRGVPHTLAMPTSVESPQGPHTGWSGDGAPGDRTLRSFATGAVIQHFTKTLNRIPEVDFRLPTEIELDALEAFQLSLGRQRELELPLALKGTVAIRGQEIFMDPNLGKCNKCHFNAGANVDPDAFINATCNFGNCNFDTGVEDIVDQPARLVSPDIPIDGGLGTDPDGGTANIPNAPPNGGFGDGTFNTPTLVEAADTGPFFHNNAIETLEGAVAFYNGDAFNNSPAGKRLLGDDGSVGINLDATQVVEVAAFLRVINALENIRQSIDLISRSRQSPGGKSVRLLTRAVAEIDDSIDVLRGGGLHPKAVMFLQDAKRITQCTADGGPSCAHRGNTDAITILQNARSQMTD
jgi:cytochrome c peroxidase